jgi:DNA-binding MarR family transcriptional regulator
MAAWRTFLTAHAVVVRVLERELLESQHLPLAEYDVMVQLNEAEGGRLRMAQLADMVLLSRSGLTRLVERLEGAGLVRREVCPSDARGAYAVLTGQGRKRLKEAGVRHRQSIQAHFAGVLDCAQVNALQDALEQIVAANVDDRGSSARGCGGPKVVEQED